MNQTFSISPGGGKPLWFTVLIALLLLVVIFIMALSGYSSQKTNFQVSSQGLRIKGDLYGRLIPQSKLIIESAREINLNQESQYQPKFRTFGTGLPGYQAGWFRLKNGERALLYLTDYQRVILIPTTDNYLLILSIQQPDQFLNTLKQSTN